VDSLDAQVSAEVLATVGLELHHTLNDKNNILLILNSLNIEKLYILIPSIIKRIFVIHSIH
jgi:hypothetical protein